MRFMVKLIVGAALLLAAELAYGGHGVVLQQAPCVASQACSQALSVPIQTTSRVNIPVDIVSQQQVLVQSPQVQHVPVQSFVPQSHALQSFTPVSVLRQRSCSRSFAPSFAPQRVGRLGRERTVFRPRLFR